MKIDLSNKTAVVTGSTAGIGFAVAEGLATAGASTVINGRTQASVDQARAALKDAVPGAIVRGVIADLGSAQGCETAADILINNVGIYGPQDFFDIPDGEWTRLFEVNVMSGVRLARAYLAGMLERNWGRVIFLSSESALNIPVDMIHYGVTKAANLAVARGVAKWAAGTGVTVHAVLPRPDPVGGCRGDAEGCRGAGRPVHRGGGRRVRQGAPAVLDHPTRRDRRGGRQSGGLRRLAPGVGHDRRCAPGRRRRGRHDRLTLGSLALAWYRLFAQKCPRQCRTGRNTGSGADLLRRGAPGRVRSVESWIIVVKRT
jgi:NAD(P)-dependent dehydrogenase (short-subunit alcohol dehydrogenase family)